MGYFVDWTNPEFPRIRDASDGDELGTVAFLILHHHLEIIKAHCRAIERLLEDVSDQTDTGHHD